MEVLKSCVYPRPIALRSEVWEVNLIKGEMGNLDAGIDPGNITKLGLFGMHQCSKMMLKKKSEKEKEKSEKEKEKSARSLLLVK